MAGCYYDSSPLKRPQGGKGYVAIFVSSLLWDPALLIPPCFGDHQRGNVGFMIPPCPPPPNPTPKVAVM